MKTGFLTHEFYFWHDTGSALLGTPIGDHMQPMAHPESAESKRRVRNLVEVSELLPKLEVLQPEAASDDAIARVHTREYIEELKSLSDNHGGVTGEHVQFGRGSYDIAKLSTGGVMAAADAIMEQQVTNAYTLVRPPGHHAEADQARGFCLLANIPITIRHLQARYGLKRIAVIDWDVHHGNGTESIFYDDPSVLTISIHEDGNYPEDTGANSDRGKGDGEGFNINVPLPPGSGFGAYQKTFSSIVAPALQTYQPEMIIVASGFDASKFDPLGRMLLSSEAYRYMTQQLMQLAAAVCDSRLLVVHEGGYSAEYVPFCALAVLEQLCGHRSNITDPFKDRIEKLKYQALQLHQANVIETAMESVTILGTKIDEQSM
ncbi:class II histone deacetylase [Pseudomaricurvus alkylphenolicus]|uniref:class II histone deacetylase n=1 Tax=Pseudomaricurvus alkylphenolicus TaxID=1306991 RepID=UPI00142292B8|nr:class II histone deacetylase [Pseudomaricurvus alkylphenolicus]NIB40751.1 class II histone deacetylase [Pseudomaricurvus alkylphenolicus]